MAAPRKRGTTKTWEGLGGKMTPAAIAQDGHFVYGKRFVPCRATTPQAAIGPDHHLPDSSIAKRAPINAVTASSGKTDSRRTTVASGAPDTRCAAAR